MKTSPSTNPEGAIVGQETDINNVLKNDAFAEFLTRFDDFESVAENNDEAKLHERFEMFQKKEGLKKDLRDFYRGDIKEEIGLDLSDADLKDVDAYVEGLVLKDAMHFRNIVNDFRLVKENESKIAACKDKIEEYRKIAPEEAGKEIDRIKQKAKAIKIAIDSERVFGVTGKLSRGFKKIVTFGFGRHSSDMIRKIVSRPTEEMGFGLTLDFKSLTAELEKAKVELAEKQKNIVDRATFLDAADKNVEFIDSLKQEIFAACDLSEKLAVVAKQVADKKFKELLSDPEYEAKIQDAEKKTTEKQAEIEKVQVEAAGIAMDFIDLEKNKADIDKKIDKIELDLEEEKDQTKINLLKKTEGDLYDERLKLTKEIKSSKARLDALNQQIEKTGIELNQTQNQGLKRKPVSEKSLAEAQKIIDGLNFGVSRDSAYTDGVIGLTDVEEMSEQIKNSVDEAIAEAIKSTSVSKGGFAAMDKALEKLIAKGTIGTMSGADVIEFVRHALDETLKSLPNDKDAKLKKLFVRSMMYNLTKAA